MTTALLGTVENTPRTMRKIAEKGLTPNHTRCSQRVIDRANELFGYWRSVLGAPPPAAAAPASAVALPIRGAADTSAAASRRPSDPLAALPTRTPRPIVPAAPIPVVAPGRRPDSVHPGPVPVRRQLPPADPGPRQTDVNTSPTSPTGSAPGVASGTSTSPTHPVRQASSALATVLASSAAANVAKKRVILNPNRRTSDDSDRIGIPVGGNTGDGSVGESKPKLPLRPAEIRHRGDMLKTIRIEATPPTTLGRTGGAPKRQASAESVLNGTATAVLGPARASNASGPVTSLELVTTLTSDSAANVGVTGAVGSASTAAAIASTTALPPRGLDGRRSPLEDPTAVVAMDVQPDAEPVQPSRKRKRSVHWPEDDLLCQIREFERDTEISHVSHEDFHLREHKEHLREKQAREALRRGEDDSLIRATTSLEQPNPGLGPHVRCDWRFPAVYDVPAERIRGLESAEAAVQLHRESHSLGLLAWASIALHVACVVNG